MDDVYPNVSAGFISITQKLLHFSRLNYFCCLLMVWQVGLIICAKLDRCGAVFFFLLAFATRG